MPPTPQTDIHPLAEAWFTETTVDIPESVSRKWLRHIVAEALEALGNDERGAWPERGPVRLTLTNQALIGVTCGCEHDGVSIHLNAAGSVIAIDLPEAPLSVDAVGNFG